MPYPIRLQCIHDRVDHCSRGTDGGRLTDAFGADGMVRRRGHGLPSSQLGHSIAVGSW